MELEHLIDRLKMDYLGPQLDAVCEQAAKDDLGYREFLVSALSCEWQGRYQKGTQSRLKQARLPTPGSAASA